MQAYLTFGGSRNRIFLVRFLKFAVSSVLVCAGTAGGILLAQAPERARVKFAQVNVEDMREWLGYLASDELQGRQTFTEGYGLAASYVAGLLKQWGVKPLGDGGTLLRRRRIQRLQSHSQFVGDSHREWHVEDVQAWRSRDISARARREADTDVHWRRVHRLRASRRSAESRREGQARGLDAEPRAGACGRAGGGRGGAAIAINTNRAAAAIGFAPAPTPTDAERALTQAREALQKATEAVQQAQAQLQGRGAARRGADAAL